MIVRRSDLLPVHKNRDLIGDILHSELRFRHFVGTILGPKTPVLWAFSVGLAA